MKKQFKCFQAVEFCIQIVLKVLRFKTSLESAADQSFDQGGNQMGTVQTKFGVLLERRFDRDMMVARKSRAIAIQLVGDDRSTGFNVVVDKRLQ